MNGPLARVLVTFYGKDSFTYVDFHFEVLKWVIKSRSNFKAGASMSTVLWSKSLYISPSVSYLQKYTRRRSFLQYQNSDFLFYLGWSGSLSANQAQYNEGCSELNYLLVEVW